MKIMPKQSHRALYFFYGGTTSIIFSADLRTLQEKYMMKNVHLNKNPLAVLIGMI